MSKRNISFYETGNIDDRATKRRKLFHPRPDRCILPFSERAREGNAKAQYILIELDWERWEDIMTDIELASERERLMQAAELLASGFLLRSKTMSIIAVPNYWTEFHHTLGLTSDVFVRLVDVINEQRRVARLNLSDWESSKGEMKIYGEDAYERAAKAAVNRLGCTVERTLYFESKMKELESEKSFHTLSSELRNFVIWQFPEYARVWYHHMRGRFNYDTPVVVDHTEASIWSTFIEAMASRTPIMRADMIFLSLQHQCVMDSLVSSQVTIDQIAGVFAWLGRSELKMAWQAICDYMGWEMMTRIRRYKRICAETKEIRNPTFQNVDGKNTQKYCKGLTLFIYCQIMASRKARLRRAYLDAISLVLPNDLHRLALDYTMADSLLF